MEVNEKNFISQIKKRNEKAMEYLLRNYGGLMKSAIDRVLFRYPQDSEECLYDSVMRIWDNISSYDPDTGSFSSWAAAVSKYCALDRLRKLAKIIPQTEIIDELLEDKNKVSDNAEFNEFFAELVECLKEDDRELFMRIFLLGETADEVAKRSGVKKSVIYNRVSRGRRKILKSHPELVKGETFQ